MPIMPYELLPPAGSDHAEEWIRLGFEAQLANKLTDAERHYRQALRLNPRHPRATQNLAILFAQQHNLTEALLTIERAAMFDGVEPLIHTNRAIMCLDAERIEEALSSARHAVKLSEERIDNLPAYINSRTALALMCATAGRPEDALPLYSQVLAKDPQHGMAAPNSCFVQTLTDLGPADLLKQRKLWYEANRFKGEKKPHTNAKTTDRPLRVGYVGGDFKRHSAAMIFGNVVLNHSPDVEPYFYSTLPLDVAADDMTRRFVMAAGWDGKSQVGRDNPAPRWRDIFDKSDEAAEAMIRKDGIDILVDLAAHTHGGRLALFTRKPAPVQVTAWGFAHGTGVDEIDYFFADPVAVPESERQHYAEKILDLPSIVTYLEPTEYKLKGTSRLPYHENEYLTFGAYARFEKFSDECLRTFAEILRRVPESKLEFKDFAFRRPYSLKRVMGLMPDIAPERLLFTINTTHPEHLLAYQRCDLILNPFPHSGGLVSCEQLYQGVPFITLCGTQAAGRTGASLLAAMGRTDWIAKTPAEYVEKAVALAGDIPQLQKVRKTLRAEFLACPAVAGYAKAVEEAYKRIWKTWCES